MQLKTAVVIGLGAYNDLGVCRSCGQAGMEVILWAPRSMVVPIYHSKYVTWWSDVDTNDEHSVMLALEDIAEDALPGDEMYIYPTGDPPALFAGIGAKATRIRKVTFMEERTDILNALQGKISKTKWLLQLIGADVLLWWNWRDPMPTLAHYKRKLTGN